LRIIILTTETPHHLYFIKKISAFFPINGIAVESRILKPDFPTQHSFESARDRYEIQELLGGRKVRFDDYSETRVFHNINDDASIDFVSGLNPDVIVTYGTGLIKKPMIRLCPEGIINLHGGDPEHYRGLDTHLWAIYHRDFDQLIVTLHRLNPKLDDGEIISKAKIQLKRTSEISKLRAENTKLCVKSALSALSGFKQLGSFISWPQRGKGRYYSFMPAPLKDICVRNFTNHLRQL